MSTAKRQRVFLLIVAATLLSEDAFAGGVSATGGAKTNYFTGSTNWTAHISTNSGSFTVPRGGEVEYLVVTGGG